MARLFIIVNLMIIINLTARVASNRPVYNENDSDEDDDHSSEEEEEQEDCPKNEEFSNCIQNVCRELTCKERDQPLACTTRGEVKPRSCKKGCVCMSGYLRNAKGKCVQQNQCYGNLVCKDDEIVNTCPNFGFDDRCPRSEKEAELRAKTVSGPCSKKPVCTCRVNYRRAKNGTCIPTRNCPPFKCRGRFEEFNACPPICPSGDCSQATLSGKCPLPGRIGILLICHPSCRCKSGYFKNNGVCVPYAECPGKCQENEEFSTCAQAICRAENCTQLGQPIACPRIMEGFCEERCVCIQGTLRNANGNCVPEDQCPTPKCDENEEFNRCPGGCDPVSCPKSYKAEQDSLATCVSPAVCGPAECTCRKNYRRDVNGECIYIGNCPGICPDNEVFSDGTDTPDGEPGCVCQEGTSRDEQGNCSAPTCGENEEFNTCPGGCDPVSCPKSYKAEQDSLATCITTFNCRPAKCTCRKYYRRDSNGDCIYIGDCPGICPDNEVFSDGTDTPDGEPGCVCQEGTSRDEQGNCSAPACGENEEFNTCPGGCDPVSCPKSYKAEQEYLANCITTFNCRPAKCTCRKYYRRDSNGDCIYIGDCPGICPDNEVFSDGTDTPDGEPGCVCQEGTSRDEQGNCSAPACGENEEFNTCPGGCDPVSCPKSYKEEQDYLANCITTFNCRPAKCTCRKYYRRDSNGDCIYIGDCPGICPDNEVFSDGTDTPDGEPGCVCQEGTSRDEQGNCSAPACGENEEFNTCPGGCDPVSCPKSYKAEQDSLATCVSPAVCGPAECTCRKYYRRDCNGDCIYIGDCPGICPDNEVFSDGTDTPDGEPGCICQEGTSRDEQGKCSAYTCIDKDLTWP